MRAALRLTGATHPHPNPRVGSVIVADDGVVVGSGAHERPGEPHAERLALDGRRLPGATLVVTLEPCSHHGRTPPCTDAIIESGVSTVVIGAIDPDERVAGSGIEALRRAGIEVMEGILSDEVEANDPAYFHHRRTGRPRYTVKLATTLDGQAAAADGTSQWITGEAARNDVHELRSTHDAVIVGAGTLIADDPRLNVRIDGYGGPQPRPVIVKGKRPLPSGSKALDRDPIVLEPDAGGAVSIEEIDSALIDAGILSALVEGGPSLARSFIGAGRADEVVWYVAPKIALGSGLPAIAGTFMTLTDAIDVEITSVDRIGRDLRIKAIPSRSTDVHRNSD